MPKLIGKTVNRYYIYIDDIPLVGHIAFGVIDRGTNVLQIRPTTICPYNCIFCSVDAGPKSVHRQSEYVVDWRHLVKWAKHVRDVKGDVLEALIDGVGEPPTHPRIVDIVAELKKIFPRVAMESRGYTLTKNLIDSLDNAGLDRLNISIDSLDPQKSRMLQGVSWYNPEKVMEIVEYIVKNTKIDVHLTPVWIPGVNDEDIEKIIEWGLRVGVGKVFPPFGIQKYEIHKYGRKIPGVKDVSWSVFRKFLERLEKKYGVNLYYKKLDFGIKPAKRYPIKYRKGDALEVIIVSPGWLRNEVIAVDKDFDTTITVAGIQWVENIAGKKLRVEIISNEDGIYIAKPLKSEVRIHNSFGDHYLKIV
ncbi:radical SAM protein [Ignisphaera sp. 4213-co]|uniref:Radical SAM protein n=1 Tax=Ignisphaera cupida TaxID=3050454 RepID=A0ABD4Z7V9_9CREN|nr:radical SAM protein [Ignisphaera sp. 4213-co]MDK6029426.1 radical SAM protein [Ignisphaera sp. 4213-co]